MSVWKSAAVSLLYSMFRTNDFDGLIESVRQVYKYRDPTV